MKNAFSDSNQIRKVSSFSELVNTHFQGETNAILLAQKFGGRL